MTVLTRKEKKEISNQFQQMLENSPRLKRKSDREMVEKAFLFANEAHKNMRRRSGDPYIFHPLAVARIVSEEIGLGALSISCALLHDVVEDTEYTIDDIEHYFGKKTAKIIDGLTKISGAFDNQTSTQAENFRKILLTLSDDVRVILIKLADRLHNMRTLHAMPENKQLKIASETIFIYAPLAHRLGLYAIKTELEDLSLKYRHPQVYEEIANKIKEKEKSRVAEINKFAIPVIEALEENKIQFDINGRHKSIYSIWKKMQSKNVPFEEVYDLLAIRIIFEPKPRISEKAMCWNIYSLITDIYIPKPDRLRDWISKPKANGYEALHATVMGPTGKWVEVQIRSRRMDEIAERGYAAHWKYKGDNSQANELDIWLKKIRELLEDPNENALEFLDEFKLNLYASEILVFTPKGQIKSLPKNASALDFAYEIHSEIGNHAIGAKVNHRLVPLSYRLSSGDQVEILTSDKQKPQREWLEFVNTVKAKVNIKKALKTDTRNRTQAGKLKLENHLKELDIPMNTGVFRKLLEAYALKSKDELYARIGLGLIDLSNIDKIIKQKSRNKFVKYWGLQFLRSRSQKSPEKKTNLEGSSKISSDHEKLLVLHEDPDATEPAYQIASCCKPIPGDQVSGYQDPETESVIIHKSNCPVMIKLASEHGERILPVKWTTHKVLSFLARIQIRGIDRIGILNEITSVTSKVLNINIRSLNVDVHDGIFDATLDLYVHSTVHLNNLVYEIARIKGVEKVYRDETFSE